MNKNFLPSFSVCFLLMAITQTGFSQALCGFDEIHQRNMTENPGYRKAAEATELQIQQYLRAHKNELSRQSATNSVLFTIPVVVHVVHTGGAVGSIYNPTDAQITGAIDYLNQVYNGSKTGTEGVGDIQIQFALALRRSNCSPTTGIDRIDGSSLPGYAANGVKYSAGGMGIPDLTLKNFDRWDASSFYNIWVVNKIDGNDGTTGQFIAGYAYFPGADHFSDGTVILATQMNAGQKTLPHEIGHALNLYHTFEGSLNNTQCPNNTDCSVNGDKICDTDPVKNNYDATTGIYDFTCRTGTNVCLAATSFSINTEHNYMSYTNCFSLFTAGQKERMLATMSLLPNRASLASSWALATSYPFNFIAPIAASCTPKTSDVGLSVGFGFGFAGVLGVTINNKTFSSDDASAAMDNGYLDRTDKCMFLLPLIKNNTYTFSGTVLGFNAERLRAWIDYDNNGVFDNTTEEIFFNNSIAASPMGKVTVSGTFTVPGNVVTNKILRMRIMDELINGGGNELTGACVDPVYGQAEDYPVFIAASALPIKLEYFKGVKKDADALLTWKTSFEQNAQSFTIEKSIDGVSFSGIGTVAATNNAGGSMYSFTDKNMNATVNYYRLKQTDLDLKSELSDVVIIRSNDGIAGKLKITPNPFAEQINISFGNAVTGNATIILFDITGRKIMRKNYTLSSGQLINIDLSSFRLTSGNYILQASTANETITTKLIRQ